MKIEFKYTFQITKKVIFKVSYYTLGKNKYPYFATSAAEFNQPKTDFNICGQCQKELLTGVALAFFKKYDVNHLLDLDDTSYADIVSDIEALKNAYNYTERQGFYEQKELSKMPLKANKKAVKNN